MKLRLGTSHLSDFLHRPARHGHGWRDHEGIFRAIQLVLMVVVALVGAKLIAWVAIEALRAVSGFLS